jgi:hypothetical protein
MKYFTKFAIFLIVICSFSLIIVEPKSNEQTLLIYAIGFNVLVIILSIIINKKD